MLDPDQALSQFIDAWNAGERPRLNDVVQRVAPEHRDRLVDLLTAWLAVAPPPRYSDAARAAIRADPSLQRALAAIDAERGGLPAQLGTLRARRRLSVRELASQVVDRLGLGPAVAGDPVDRVARYLEQVEGGEHDPDRLSWRVLDALGEALGTSAAALADAVLPRMSAPSQALFRADVETSSSIEQDLDVLTAAAMAPAPPPMDELDRLFHGGPEGG